MKAASESEINALQRRIAELEARQLPDALRALHVLDTIFEAVCVLDRNWTYIYANAPAVAMARMPRDRILGGSTLWELFPGLAGSSAQTQLELAMRERVHSAFEFYYEPYALWVAVSAYPSADGLALIIGDITARKQAEQQVANLNHDLARRIREFETLLMVTPVGVAIASDPECHEIRGNPAMAALLGAPVEENISKTGPAPEQLSFRTLHKGRELPGSELPMQVAAREGREVRDFELEIQRADGGLVTELAFAAPLFDEGQRIRGSIGIFVDITERRRTEKALQASEERYRFLAEALPQLVWTRDSTGFIDWANQHLLEYLGEHPRRMSIEGWQDHVHPDDLAEFRQAIGHRQRGEPYDHEFRLRRHDGAFRWMLARVRPFAQDDGLHWLGTAIDIDDRRRLEQSVRDSEERLRLAADAGKIGLWDWDIRNDKIVWSDRVYEFHGLLPGSFPGTLEAFQKLVHPDDAQRVGDAVQAAIQTGSPYEVEFRAILPNGDVRWLNTSARIIYDASGNPARMTGATFDITQRREGEEALRRSNAELEEFAYAASHDLQEPLRMVSLYTELLLRRLAGPEDAQPHEFVGLIRNGLSRMDLLIRDLLSYSRIIHEERESSGRTDLAASLEQARAVLQLGIAEAGASIEAGALPCVRGDQAQFAVLFQNLLSNALKYRKAGEPCRIAISAERREAEWVVCVSDNGIGFEQVYAERIFGLFKRLHRDEYAGTGLGLAICKRIIERQGGRIWAESKTGDGARFYFAVPAWD